MVGFTSYGLLSGARSSYGRVQGLPLVGREFSYGRAQGFLRSDTRLSYGRAQGLSIGFGYAQVFSMVGRSSLTVGCKSSYGRVRGISIGFSRVQGFSLVGHRFSMVAYGRCSGAGFPHGRAQVLLWSDTGFPMVGSPIQAFLWSPVGSFCSRMRDSSSLVIFGRGSGSLRSRLSVVVGREVACSFSSRLVAVLVGRFLPLHLVVVVVLSVRSPPTLFVFCT